MRERRQARHRRPDPPSRWEVYWESSDGALSSCLRMLSYCAAEVKHGELILHATRFGLFCAMAWSLNSMILSVLRLCAGDV